MKKTLGVGFAVLLFAFGLFAGETLKPTGYSWGQIGSGRQLGYVEGFEAGEGAAQFTLCNKQRLRESASMHTEDCIIYKLREDTLVDLDALVVIDTINKFYNDPRNASIKWSHALVISRAMMSGVHVSDEDLDVVRQLDAKQ
jgi:hypothetical protein